MKMVSMKHILVALFILASGRLFAQPEPSSGTLKIGGGYTHDFPGLNGYTLNAEYLFPVISQLQGGFGLKHVDLEGFPRTTQVQEFTKANTIDLNLYWVPLQSETQLFRIGLGYSFSFYNIKRAYPIITGSGSNKVTTWPSQTASGRTTGINLIAEYEYNFPNSAFSVGLRGALYKAYDRTWYAGPMIGYRFL
jgi:hypothetical protein